MSTHLVINKTLSPEEISSLGELLGKAGLDAVLAPSHVMSYRDLSLDIENLLISFAADGNCESVSIKEARLLKVFMQKPNTCLTREFIKKSVWGDIAVSPRTIDSQISRLRKRLALAGVLIENVYGDGYIFR